MAPKRQREVLDLDEEMGWKKIQKRHGRPTGKYLQILGKGGRVNWGNLGPSPGCWTDDDDDDDDDDDEDGDDKKDSNLAEKWYYQVTDDR